MGIKESTRCSSAVGAIGEPGLRLPVVRIRHEIRLVHGGQRRPGRRPEVRGECPRESISLGEPPCRHGAQRIVNAGASYEPPFQGRLEQPEIRGGLCQDRSLIALLAPRPQPLEVIGCRSESQGGEERASHDLLRPLGFRQRFP